MEKPVRYLDPAITLQMLANYKGPDLIQQEIEKEAELLKDLTCKCGSRAIVKITQMVWKEEEGELVQRPAFGKILPRRYFKCKDCEEEFAA